MMLHLTAQGSDRTEDGHGRFLRLVALPLIKAALASIFSSNQFFLLLQNNKKRHKNLPAFLKPSSPK
jgi:hypothetical protein